jgi:hypothetical protein
MNYGSNMGLGQSLTLGSVRSTHFWTISAVMPREVKTTDDARCSLTEAVSQLRVRDYSNLKTEQLRIGQVIMGTAVACCSFNALVRSGLVPSRDRNWAGIRL